MEQEAQDRVKKEAEPGVEYEYLQCHATVVNNTDYRLNLIEIDPNMWGKWIQSPTDVPAGSKGEFSSQGRSDSPSGTEAWLKYTLRGSDPGAIIELSFSVPFTGKNNYSIKCTPKGAVKVREEDNGSSGSKGIVTYTIG